jgi:hypothetical protein
VEPERSKLVVGERAALVRGGALGKGEGVRPADAPVSAGHAIGQLPPKAQVHDVTGRRSQKSGDLARRQEFRIVSALGHRLVHNL